MKFGEKVVDSVVGYVCDELDDTILTCLVDDMVLKHF